MTSPIVGKRIVLGVTGSIACYKSAYLASKLHQAGAQVDTLLTQGAQRFVTPLTFQSVTGRRAYVDDDLWGTEAHVLHVGLAQEADLMVVAPATAHTLAKLAQGQADNLLSITALAATCPLLLAPAMDGGMFTHAATQSNLALLRERGALIVGPEEGHLASGLVARGRMSEPETLLGAIRRHLSRSGPLAGLNFVVTAGGTREALDPVRFLTNHSSGKQGYALAQAALDAGADVSLISSVDRPAPAGAHVTPVGSAEEMASAVLDACAGADCLLMAAAVADYRPAQVARQKIKKNQNQFQVDLVRNPDILMEVARQRRESGRPRVVVGFAAETENLRANAAAKAERKALDLIVANDVSAADAGFGVETNRVSLIRRDGSLEELPLMSKEAVAQRVIQQVIDLLGLNEGER